MSMFNNRQNRMDLFDTYFYTQTIESFSRLLVDDNLKMIIINSLKHFVKNELITLFGYVIMPNHIHFLWSILKMNGKETVAGSFSKYTAHEFRKYLMLNDIEKLNYYRTNKKDRKHQFWKRDALAIPITTETIFEQKL